VIVNTCSCIDHDCVVGDFVHVAPGARICGGVEVGAGSLVGAGCVIVPGIKVGAGCVLGAGAVVLDDIPAGTRVAGNPARPL
jgi:acetyltransferase-like isoleucine patch superfamily enzyme